MWDRKEVYEVRFVSGVVYFPPLDYDFTPLWYTKNIRIKYEIENILTINQAVLLYYTLDRFYWTFF